MCTFASIISGVLGYSWAVKSTPYDTAVFVQASLVGMIVGSFLVSIASYRKSRFLTKWAGSRIYLRSSISISISLFMTVLSYLTAFLVWWWGGTSQFFLFISLLLSVNTLQLLSYSSSSLQQVVNLNVFWRFQLAGATIRLASVIVLVVALDISFLGLLISNVLASAAIALLYRSLKINLRFFARDLYFALFHLRSLVKLDGVLRSFRLSFEQQIMMLIVTLLDIAILETEATKQAAYASIGFLGAAATSLRQIFASNERDELLNKNFAGSHTWVRLGCTAAAVLLWNLDAITSLYLIVLPDLENGGTRTILRALALYLLFYPATIGFAFADYLSGSQVYIFARSLLLTSVMFAMLTVTFHSVWIDHQSNSIVWPIWAAAPGLTIWASLRYLRWKCKSPTSFS